MGRYAEFREINFHKPTRVWQDVRNEYSWMCDCDAIMEHVPLNTPMTCKLLEKKVEYNADEDHNFYRTLRRL